MSIIPRLVNDCAVAFFEDLSSIGYSSTCFHVWKVEPDCQVALFCEFRVKVSYEGRVHWPSGAVGDDQTSRRFLDFGRDGVDDAGLATSGELDLRLLKLV